METVVIEKVVAPIAQKVLYMVYRASQGRPYATFWETEEFAINSADRMALREGITAVVRMDSTVRNDESGIMERAGLSLARW